MYVCERWNLSDQSTLVCKGKSLFSFCHANFAVSAMGSTALRKSSHMSGLSIALLRSPLISLGRSPFFFSFFLPPQSFYASASSKARNPLSLPLRAYATSLYQIIFTFFSFRAPFQKKYRRLSFFLLFPSFFFFFSNGFPFLLFALNCDALLHTHTYTREKLTSFFARTRNPPGRTIWNRAEFQ